MVSLSDSTGLVVMMRLANWRQATTLLVLGPGIEDGLGRWMIWEWITNWVLIAMSISGVGRAVGIPTLSPQPSDNKALFARRPNRSSSNRAYVPAEIDSRLVFASK